MSGHNVSQALLASYEQLPYESSPQYPMHPDCLATLATLMGMDPPAVESCRLLELGCGDGGNLLPIAMALPDSRCVGVDLSPNHIRLGTRVVEELGMANVELRAADLLDLGDELGTFDYIVCHGVYSWVPRDVQDRILAICKRNLAPRGVAYVSYNTYPGWHFRGLVKDIVKFHTRELQDAEEKLSEARGLLNFLAESLPEESPYARVLQMEAKVFRRDEDHYLFHEFLEDVNQPMYFYEFMEQAQAKGLQYLGEAWFHTRLDNLPPRVRETVQDISRSLIHREQYLDFLRARTFRRTLLCHANITLSRRPDLGQVLAMSVSAQAGPVDTPVDLASSGIAKFQIPRGETVSTNHPAVKSLFLTLYNARPRAIPAGELLEMVRQQLRDLAADPAALPTEETFAALLVQAHLGNSVVLHISPPKFAVQLSERPLASPLARLQARHGRPVVNLRHQQCELTQLEHAVLVQLDGQHDRPALLEELRQLLRDAVLVPTTDAASPTAPPALEDLLDASLVRIRDSALLLR